MKKSKEKAVVAQAKGKGINENMKREIDNISIDKPLNNHITIRTSQIGEKERDQSKDVARLSRSDGSLSMDQQMMNADRPPDPLDITENIIYVNGGHCVLMTKDNMETKEIERSQEDEMLLNRCSVHQFNF